MQNAFFLKALRDSCWTSITARILCHVVEHPCGPGGRWEWHRCQWCGYVLGITKAYTTRVGSGPFPTEQQNDIGNLLGERGHEFGTVTGRQRRCGWFDSVLVRQSATIGGIDGIALTKLDVLDGIAELKVCVGYEYRGESFDYLPADRQIQAGVEPVYETLEGWDGSTQGARSWADLPAEAVYVRRIED